MKFNIITANEIIDTGSISFKFIFDSQSDYDNHEKVKKFGYIRKDDTGGITVNIFESGKGLVFGWGNERFDDQSWLSEFIEESPEATLLMQEDDAQILKQYCESNNIEYAYHHYDGTLQTA